MSSSTATATADGDTSARFDRAWDIGTPMTPLGYYPKYGPLPAVVEVRDQTGPWDATGQTRQLMLSDGGYVIEHLVRVDREAGLFVYELSDFQKLFGRLVSGARAEWEYRATNTGTHVRWTYTFFARPGAGLLLEAIVRFAWAPYMRKVLPGILAEIDRHA
ncbi:hypothetical protein AX769_05065 [Frondihabitans sp. PAMC 28766]|uniref:SRPBCC family protein n=1 Tax=Frondihabitans sp. PAMC 28766 TaxID=1795630 RepID=UPI00078D38DD|nr:SRPBCC family protein [Frondihabitans sp. PAMC 28766]AMM19625.1 hypothetical protein AX769_05065 [Frondihabitans sp. PAMC 28766]